MEGERWSSARQALNRFLFQLLGPEDEVFLYRFDNQPELVEGWTTDRERIATGLARIRPRGATSLYDAVAESLPLAQSGRHRKKAIVVLSDGNDTNSRTTVREIKPMIRSTEVMAYAIGIDNSDVGSWGGQPSQPNYPPPPRSPIPLPFPMPGRTRPPPPPPQGYPPPSSPGRNTSRGRLDDRLNVTALRDITDDSGGRTEVVRFARDVEPATTSVADELSRQYLPGIRVARSERRPVAHDSSRAARQPLSRACAEGICGGAVGQSSVFSRQSSVGSLQSQSSVTVVSHSLQSQSSVGVFSSSLRSSV